MACQARSNWSGSLPPASPDLLKYIAAVTLLKGYSDRYSFIVVNTDGLVNEQKEDHVVGQLTRSPVEWNPVEGKDALR